MLTLIAAQQLLPSVGIDGKSIADFIQNNIIYVLFVCAAVSALVGIVNKKIRDAMIVLAGCGVVLVILFVAGNWSPLMDWAGGLIFGNK